MRQSVFTRMSKRLGVAPRKDVKIPNLDLAVSVIYRAREGNDDAFEQLFLWNRFCPTAENPQELLVINSVNEAFVELARRYRRRVS